MPQRSFICTQQQKCPTKTLSNSFELKMASEQKQDQQIVIKEINKFDFYNQFIQFLYPTLIVCDADDKKDDDVRLLLYNSTTFNLSNIENEDVVKGLMLQLRDQGSERFDKLMVVIQIKKQMKNQQKLIDILCNKIANNSKSLKTFHILEMGTELCLDNYMQVLTEEWYKTFASDHNKSKCIGYPSIPSLICDELYLGGLVTTINLFILQSLNISVIINCTKDLENYFEADHIKYHRIAIDDFEIEDITEHLKGCYKLLHEYVDSKGLSVLVHCQQGKSRSVSMIIYYLMQRNGLTVDEALQYIKRYRFTASPNQGFMKQLKQMESSEMK